MLFFTGKLKPGYQNQTLVTKNLTNGDRLTRSGKFNALLYTKTQMQGINIRRKAPPTLPLQQDDTQLRGGVLAMIQFQNKGSGEMLSLFYTN